MNTTSLGGATSIMDKFGKVLVDTGAIDSGTRMQQSARPEFTAALNREYAAGEGNEIARTYRAYAKLAKDPQFTHDVKIALTDLATSVAGLKGEAVDGFVNDALNYTEEFISRATKAAEALSPDQMQALLAKPQEEAEARRREAQSLATVQAA